jgi:hypothetical protein
LILGMHRSGTSVATRLVNLLGAELGEDLLPPTTDNLKGYWEHRVVVAIHERLLAALGRSWHDIRALPENWLSSAPAREAAQALTEVIQRDFDQAPLWAVKDPRLCRFVPLWREVLRDLGIDVAAIFVLRSPEEVARSIQVRDGLPPEDSRLSWMQHLAEAEVATRDIPRCMIAYDAMMQHWESSLVDVASVLSISWPVAPENIVSEVANFIDPSIRHHRLAAAVSDRTILAEIYTAACALAEGNTDWVQLGKLIDNYFAVAPLFTDCFDVLGADLINTQHQHLELASAQRREEGLRYLLQSQSLNQVFSDERPFADCAKVYYRMADGGYSEAVSQIQNHQGLLARTNLRFELPGVVVDFLRLDPSEFSGTFDIRELRINGRIFDLTRENICAFNSSVADRGRLATVTLSSNDSDPFIELDVRERLDAVDPVYLVEWSCRRCQSTDRLEQLIATNINAALDGVGTMLQAVQRDRPRIEKGLVDVVAGQLHAAEVQAGLVDRVDALAGQVGRDFEITTKRQTQSMEGLLSHLHDVIDRLSQYHSQAEKGLADAVARQSHVAEVQVGLSDRLNALAGQARRDSEMAVERQTQFEGDLASIAFAQSQAEGQLARLAEVGDSTASKIEVLERNVALILENSERGIFHSLRRLVRRK